MRWRVHPAKGRRCECSSLFDMASILVVDDESDMRLALSNVLRRIGHRVVESQDGEGALSLLRSTSVDMVLLDIRLPGMDGIQVLKKIRQDRKDLPVIMVTGYESLDSASQVMQLGANHYLSKPFSNWELIQAVQAILRGKEPQPEPGILGRRLALKLRGAVSPGSPAGPVPASPAAARAPALPKFPSLSPAIGAAAAQSELRRLAPGLPAPLRGALPKVLAGAAALLAAATLLYALRSWKIPAGRDHPVPYSHASAFAWEGGRLWVSDWFDQKLFLHELEGEGLRLVETYAVPGTHLMGLAAAQGYLYTSDSWARAIQKRKMEDPSVVLSQAQSPGPSPSGLFWDGRYLWSSDSGTGKIYQHELDRNLTVLSSYDSASRSPAGIFKDESHFWSADADARLLHKHRLDQRLTPIASYELPELNQGSQPLSSFAWRGDQIWLARDGVSAILERSFSRFRKIGTK